MCSLMINYAFEYIRSIAPDGGVGVVGWGSVGGGVLGNIYFLFLSKNLCCG